MSESTAIGEPMRQWRSVADNDRACRIRDETVLVDGDIELHEIAVLDPPRPGNAVHDLVIDADQHRPREAVDEGGRRTGALSCEESGRNSIQFHRTDSDLKIAFQQVERLARDARRLAHAVQVERRLNRHRADYTLPRVEMSAALYSRRRTSS